MNTELLAVVFAMIFAAFSIITVIITTGMIPVDKVRDLIVQLREFSDKTTTPADNRAVDGLEWFFDTMLDLGLIAPSDKARIVEKMQQQALQDHEEFHRHG